MKRKWHIRTRLLLTLIGTICAVLLVVALAFNLSIRQYIRLRVSSQLREVSQDASGQMEDVFRTADGRRFDEHPDRVMGTSGNAVILNSDGSLLFVLHGDEETGANLASWFASQAQPATIPYKIVTIDSGSYAVSVTDDPVTDGQYMLTYVDVTSLMSFTGRINALLLIIILAAVVLSVFLSRIVAGTLARPVQELSDFSHEIGRGDLQQQEFRFHDLEFDDLAGSMNQMVSDLNAARQKQEIFF